MAFLHIATLDNKRSHAVNIREMGEQNTTLKQDSKKEFKKNSPKKDSVLDVNSVLMAEKI